jgi:hypothetical protein
VGTGHALPAASGSVHDRRLARQPAGSVVIGQRHHVAHGS